ncbi:MAG: DNA-binding response regulator, partial [Verrucomicrobiae bacterium]|nr:DNA-binding response regulator [Verrucomicrobiae bacterium]
MSAPQTSTSPFRILVVDDEPALCELLAEVLKSLRRSVEVRDTAGGALDFVSRNPVDLAFLDVN